MLMTFSDVFDLVPQPNINTNPMMTLFPGTFFDFHLFFYFKIGEKNLISQTYSPLPCRLLHSWVGCTSDASLLSSYHMLQSYIIESGSEIVSLFQVWPSDKPLCQLRFHLYLGFSVAHGQFRHSYQFWGDLKSEIFFIQYVYIVYIVVCQQVIYKDLVDSLAFVRHLFRWELLLSYEPLSSEATLIWLDEHNSNMPL